MTDQQQNPGQDGGQELLTFKIDSLELALPLTAVERAVRSVALSTMPSKRKPFLGWFSFAGLVVPVISIRDKLGLPEKEIELEDVFLLVRIAKKTVAIVIQDIGSVVTSNASDLLCDERLEIVNKENKTVTCLSL